MRRFGLGGLGGLFARDSGRRLRDATLVAAGVYVFPPVDLWVSAISYGIVRLRFRPGFAGFPSGMHSPPAPSP